MVGPEKREDETPAAFRTRKDAWWSDNLKECHNDDFLWGCTIKNHEWLTKFHPNTEDVVMYNLIRLGTYDWSGENELKGHALQAVRYAGAVVGRLTDRTNRLKSKVR